MKRPEGYGRPAAPPPGSRTTPPAKPTRRPAAATTASAPGSSPRSAPARSVAPTPTPPKAGPQAAARDSSAAREAQAELRAARRERKRQDRAELRRFTKRSRRRRLTWFTLFAVAAVVAGLLLVAVFSPLLALREIRVQGAERLEAAEITAAVNGQLGTPLALLDEGRITRELGAFPLIKSFTTELLPPDTLAIRIVERTPIGLIENAGGFDLVDPAGIVIENTAKRPDGLPLIELGDAAPGDKAFLAMTEVLLALPSDVRKRVESIAATTKDDVTLALTNSNQTVVWGSAERSEVKALELARLLKRHKDAGPGEYDVSARGIVLFRPA